MEAMRRGRKEASLSRRNETRPADVARADGKREAKKGLGVRVLELLRVSWRPRASAMATMAARENGARPGVFCTAPERSWRDRCWEGRPGTRWHSLRPPWGNGVLDEVAVLRLSRQRSAAR